MKMNKYTAFAAVVCTSLLAPAASAVDFNGYMRAGTGISGNGSGDLSFEKQKVGRLGNENDNYSEFGFAQNLETGEQTWRLESMIASGVDGSTSSEDGGFNVAQFAVKAKGVLAFDKEATLWAGKTYYQRKDIHITDFYFLNTSGTGGGVENISVGDQKFSIALMQDNGSQISGIDKEWVLKPGGNPGNPASYEEKYKSEDVNAYIIDMRLANVNLWSDASLEVAAAYNFATAGDDQDLKADDGVMLSAILQQGLSNGFNQTVIQFGTSSYGAQMANLGAGSNFDRSGDNNDVTGYRLINWGVMNFGQSWEMGHQALYASSDYDKGTHSLASVVVRPMYKWNDTIRTIFEAGYFTESLTDDTDKAGSKLTVAQAWAMGDSFWARPEIRVYGSYITDDKGTTFGEKGDGEYVAGIQVEAWW